MTELQIEGAEEREIHLQFLLDLMRAITAWRSVPMTPSVDEVLILSAVGLGALEGRPFRAAKLADFLGINRSTLLRRLANLVEQGWVTPTDDSHYVPVLGAINAPPLRDVTDRVTDLILRAATDLDRLGESRKCPRASSAAAPRSMERQARSSLAHSEIECADVRRIHFRFIVDLMRLLTDAKAVPMASQADQILVLAAVGLGQLRLQPYRGVKLAEALQMPRATLMRRLADLVDEGWLEISEDGYYLVHPERINSPPLLKVHQSLTRLIKATAAELAELG